MDVNGHRVDDRAIRLARDANTVRRQFPRPVGGSSGPGRSLRIDDRIVRTRDCSKLLAVPEVSAREKLADLTKSFVGRQEIRIERVAQDLRESTLLPLESGGVS